MMQAAAFKQTIIIALLIVFCLSGLFDFFYQLTPLPAFEESASAYLADIRERATYSYAIARGLNALISVLESIELGIPFVSGHPGQVLEPLNDMIEQFSDIVLIALASVGAQEILIAVFGDISWTYLLPIGLLPLLIAPWWPSKQVFLNKLGLTICITVLLTRLFIPTLALSGQLITTHYLQDAYQEAVVDIEEASTISVKALDRGTKVVQELPPEISQPESSVFSPNSKKSSPTITMDNLGDVKKLVTSDQIWEALRDIPSRIITLLTIFIFETLIWPLIIGFGFLWLYRLFLKPKIN
jgi:hypothetical protein